MVDIGNGGILNETSSQPRTYKSLVSDIEQLFSPGRKLERKITKIEARWLPRRGHDSEGYPHTLVVDEKNSQAISRLILFRQGTDIIEATLETDEEKDERPSYKW
jgi:hypothetical protein